MEGNAPPKLSSISDLEDVRLIVKTANQQFEDLIVHSEPSWTVRRLKLHLCQVHPSNPSLPEQKLIYSGQLLNDELILKDILRSYKDVETENHIFHLVYLPKISATRPKLPEPKPLLNIKKQEQKLEKPIIPPPPVISSSTDGLRHRNVASSSSSSASTSASIPSVSASTSASKTPFTAASQQPQGAATSASATTTQQEQQQQQQHIPNIAFAFSQLAGAAGCLSNLPNVLPYLYPGQANIGPLTEQQVAMQNWIQQIYHNYMEQCLKLANVTFNEDQIPKIAPCIPMFMPMPQFMPPGFPNPQPTIPTATSSVPSASAYSSPPPPAESDTPGTSRAARANFAPRVIPVIPPTAAATTTATAAQQPQPGVAPTVGTAAAPAAAPAQAPAPVPAENVEQPPPQPRFPNIVQEEQDNRDWLDSFYSVTRLLALLTLVYFYSSPLRCLVVAIIAFGIYLYHTGFFQTRRQGQAQAQAQANNNNRNINNNQNINDNNAPAGGDAAAAAAAAGTAAATAQDTPPQAAAATETNQSTAGDSEPLISSAAPPGSETTTTSLIAFVRTFVVSFFASLLPETPAL